MKLEATVELSVFEHISPGRSLKSDENKIILICKKYFPCLIVNKSVEMEIKMVYYQHSCVFTCRFECDWLYVNYERIAVVEVGVRSGDQSKSPNQVIKSKIDQMLTRSCPRIKHYICSIIKSYRQVKANFHSFLTFGN